MKILIEGYPYQESDVKDILQGFEPYTKNRKTKIDHVGYFFSKEIGDCVFFLPKVLMDENNKVLFHDNLTPEAILDLDFALHKNLITEEDYKFLYNFSVWIFRAIKEYYRLNPNSEILLDKSFSLLDNSELQKDSTLLDIILSLIRFNNENQDFFMFAIKNIHSGYNKINWNKTISRSQAVVQRNSPIYLKAINKKKQINFDEELLIIFFSILSYINKKYGFSTPINYNYELIGDALFENYLAGYGLIRLCQIKYKYFSDKALKLWRLCYVFFEAAEKMNTSSQDCEYLIVRNFNIVFESIIDELIGDKKEQIDSSLKDQPDGKIVDHIYRYKSLVNSSDVYYIGDSKYYKIGGSLESNSIYKQYTYAKNVIQFNINWFYQGKKHLHYRDELTEGYNITPNFFISAEVRKELSYSDSDLKPHKDASGKECKYKPSFQFKNRLFDRDTLWLAHYDINFLYIVALYARSNEYEKSLFKEKAKTEFKRKITELINAGYDFYLLRSRGDNLQSVVDNYFKLLYGKIYRPNEENDILILALYKGAEENKEILEKIVSQFTIYTGYKLGQDISEFLSKAKLFKPKVVYTITASERNVADAEDAYKTKRNLG